MTTKEKIIELKTTTKLTNREIADQIGCSRRHVRRVIRAHHNPKDGTAPKVLLLDIETAPMEVYSWRLGKVWVDNDNIIKDWSMLSWSAKWLNDNTIMGQAVTTAEAKQRKDVSIVGGIWDLLDQADIVIAHNGDHFDIKKLNTRFILNELPPPTPYVTIDTLKVAYKYFDFASAKLVALNTILKLRQQKNEQGFDLWVRAVNGEKDALAIMLEYNKQDVLALEDLYMALRPWIKSHPNLGVYVETDKALCPTCGSDNLVWKGYYYTPANRFRSFYCGDCGAIGRSRFSDMSKTERKVLCRPTAR